MFRLLISLVVYHKALTYACNSFTELKFHHILNSYSTLYSYIICSPAICIHNFQNNLTYEIFLGIFLKTWQFKLDIADKISCHRRATNSLIACFVLCEKGLSYRIFLSCCMPYMGQSSFQIQGVLAKNQQFSFAY